MAITLPPAAPQRGDRTTFANRVDAFITWLISFVGELLALVGNLNSVAAGGAYGLPYIFNSEDVAIAGAVGTVDGGHLAFANNATTLLIDTKSLQGISVKALFTAFVSSNSAVKGTIKITKQNDPSVWAIYNISSYTEDLGGRYGYFATSYVLEHGLFAQNDQVVLQFQRTGDKGDAGPPGSLPSIYVRQELAAGSSAEALASGTWTSRNLNTTKWNDISGASVSSGVVTLPAGTYEIEASAPATSTNAHKIRLFNVTDSAVADVGMATYALSTGGMSRSHLRTRFTIASAKAYRVDHFAATGATMAGAGGAAIEVYSEFKATKVA